MNPALYTREDLPHLIGRVAKHLDDADGRNDELTNRVAAVEDKQADHERDCAERYREILQAVRDNENHLTTINERSASNRASIDKLTERLFAVAVYGTTACSPPWWVSRSGLSN